MSEFRLHSSKIVTFGFQFSVIFTSTSFLYFTWTGRTSANLSSVIVNYILMFRRRFFFFFSISQKWHLQPACELSRLIPSYRESCSWKRIEGIEGRKLAKVFFFLEIRSPLASLAKRPCQHAHTNTRKTGNENRWNASSVQAPLPIYLPLHLFTF